MKNALIKTTLILALFSGSLNVIAAPAQESLNARYEALSTEIKPLLDAGKPAEAATLYVPLARKGHLGAQANAGFLYFVGQQNKKAFYWLQKAANRGDANSQTALGMMYAGGMKGADGVYPQKNVAKARYWYQKAAKQSFKPAIEKLQELDN